MQIPSVGTSFAKYMPNPLRHSFALFPVTRIEMEEIIDHMNGSKSVGPFSIPIKLLKILKKFLSSPLEYLFNYSFSIGKVPCKFKNRYARCVHGLRCVVDGVIFLLHMLQM